MNNEALVAFFKKNPIALVCGVLSPGLAALIYFRSSNIPEADAELAQKSAEADRYESNLKNADKLKEQFEAMVAANKEIDSRLIRAGQLAINNQYFYELESQTGTKIVEYRQVPLTAAARAAKTAFMPIGFAVSVQGNLSQVLQFLRALESNAHYCRITTAVCSVAGANRGAGLLTLQLNLELLGQP